MSSTLLYCIIGGAVLLALIVATIFIRRSNKKRFQRLQENINKYKKENEAFDNDNRIVLANDEPESENQEEKQPVAHIKPENAVVEDYYEEPPKPINQNRNRSNQYNYRRNNLKNAVKSQNQNEDDDFEQFLNEHSYSRKILSGDLISKLQDLPPEIKAVILSNVFNKYDDDK